MYAQTHTLAPTLQSYFLSHSVNDKELCSITPSRLHNKPLRSDMSAHIVMNTVVINKFITLLLSPFFYNECVCVHMGAWHQPYFIFTS